MSHISEPNFNTQIKILKQTLHLVNWYHSFKKQTFEQRSTTRRAAKKILDRNERFKTGLKIYTRVLY